MPVQSLREGINKARTELSKEISTRLNKLEGRASRDKTHDPNVDILKEVQSKVPFCQTSKSHQQAPFMSKEVFCKLRLGD